jgi:hypothetical protein
LNFSGVIGGVVGYGIVSNVGCALGVYLIGNSGNEKGSFSSALGGSVVGTLVGGGLAYLMAQSNKNADGISPAYAILVIGGQVTGAVIGFNHSRKKKVEAPTSSLSNLDNGRLSLSFPQVNLSTDSKISSSYRVNLFQAKF